MDGPADEVDDIVAAWRRERPDLDVTPLEVLSRVDRLADLLTASRRTVLDTMDLRRHEFDVLVALRREGEPYRLTAGELASRTHVTSGTMTSRLDGLSERGLLRRVPDQRDGRLVRVELTKAGRDAVDRAFAALVEVERQLLAPLSEEQRTMLAEALRALLEPGTRRVAR